MQGVSIRQYGPPEVLQYGPLPDLQPSERQVLIRVHAASVNPIDWRIRSGSLRWVRPARFPAVLGFDVAGTVEQCGRAVTQWRPGDDVYAFLDNRLGGGYGQYALASADVVARKPEQIDFAESAAVPLTGCTALQILRDYGQVQPGQRVLINGASGGVGTFAVQVARLLGAEVTGVCGSDNVDLVEQLGATRAIDYHREDFTRGEQRFHVVVDAVAKSSFARCRGILVPQGRYITTVPGPQSVFFQAATWAGSPFGVRRCHTMLAHPSSADLRQLQQWIDAGRLRVILDRRLPLHQAAQAHRLSEQGHTRGKLVLEVEAAGAPRSSTQ